MKKLRRFTPLLRGKIIVWISVILKYCGVLPGVTVSLTSKWNCID